LKNILDLDIDQIATTVVDLGQPSYRVKQIYAGIQNGLELQEITNLPKDFAKKLSNQFFGQLILKRKLVSVDKIQKYLLQLSDGQHIETVFLPNSYGNTVCISTQVGCKMNCAFCASGLNGFVRNLSVGEMLGQVIKANQLNGGTTKKRAVNNVVLMGSGEPLDNFEHVIEFVLRCGDKAGLNISKRNISISTCGLVDKIYQLADSAANGITLTISLHATTDEMRKTIMPIAKSVSIKDLFTAAKYYFEKSGRRVVFEYALIKGVNNNHFDAVRLVELTKGLPCHINLIRLNDVKERELKSIGEDETKKFLKKLKDNNVSATIRKSQGADIYGACGQLRNNILK